MIPGASELIKTLLTEGDNPGKAVKDHVLLGRGAEGDYGVVLQWLQDAESSSV